MSVFKLAIKSLLYYRRTNLAVLSAVALCGAVLTGALIIGDSVSYSLEKITRERLGTVKLAMVKKDGFFTYELAPKLSRELGTETAGGLYLTGTITTGDEKNIVNQINVYAVDDAFFALSDSKADEGFTIENDTAVINRALAQRLNVTQGDAVVITIPKPSALPAGSALTAEKDRTLSFRLTVGKILDAEHFGRFNLNANQSWPMNAYVSLDRLAHEIQKPGRINMLLAAGETLSPDRADQALDTHCTLADLGLEITHRDSPRPHYAITSESIFINTQVTRAIAKADSQAVGILTYFVNSLSANGRSTPYSMVSAIPAEGPFETLAPKDHDGITITDWLAEDLAAKPGDTLTLSYYVLAADMTLEEKSRTFTVSAIAAMDTPGIGPELMPDFPGLANADSCSEWESPVPIDLSRIRDKDERYWDEYRGTPKAFIRLNEGQQLWSNAYGDLTEIRLPAAGSINDIETEILNKVPPAAAGLFFIDVRSMGFTAAGGSTDFGQLFLGLSMFLIFSALILMTLTFVFGLEKRTEQVGLLKAVGLNACRTQFVFLIEAGLLALVGSLVGVLLGIAYTKSLILGLRTVWQDAIAGSRIYFHMTPLSLAVGACTALVLSVLVIGWYSRKLMKNTPAELLSGSLRWQFFMTSTRPRKHILLRLFYGASLAAGLSLAAWGFRNQRSDAGAFFGSGGLLLVGLILMAFDFVKRAGTSPRLVLKSATTFALKNTSLRPGRSLAVVALTACGVFMIIAVGANRTGGVSDPHRRHSATGGFELWAESSIGVTRNLNTPDGRRELGFQEGDLAGTDFVNMRLFEADQASCLNLNRAQRPSVLGVDAEKLARLDAFSFDKIANKKEHNPWLLLKSERQDSEIPVIPAFADYNTAVWVLGKKLGDTIKYIDRGGRKFFLRIDGFISSSVLQGYLIIDEEAFVKYFPQDAGYRIFLADVPPGREQEMMNLLSRRLSTYGLSIVTAPQRMANFLSVQNTYISIFQVLGGLGLALGTIGVGVVVVRNVLDRRGELAMLTAVGYTRQQLQNMVYIEHIILLLSGIAAGLIGAIVAVLPALQDGFSLSAWFSIFITSAGIAGAGALWTWWASKIALKGELMDALRNE